MPLRRPLGRDAAGLELAVVRMSAEGDDAQLAVARRNGGGRSVLGLSGDGACSIAPRQPSGSETKAEEKRAAYIESPIHDWTPSDLMLDSSRDRRNWCATNFQHVSHCWHSLLRNASPDTLAHTPSATHFPADRARGVFHF